MTQLDISNEGAQFLDADGMKRKYLEERDKRLQVDRNKFLKLSGKYAHLADDPHVETRIDRDAVLEEVETVVVGGGFSGLLAAASLRKVGAENIRIIEKAGDFGGTWYWNRYPGVRCDVESYTYLPLLEEVGYMPTEKYATGEEIWKYCQMLGRHFDLYKDSYFQTEITSIRWEEADSRWHIRTDRDDLIKTRYLLLGTGPLNHAKLPDIPGIEEFEGHLFHTNRWDYAYSGGDQRGDLSNLRDKRIAMVGTGATGIQCMPIVAKDAQHLYVVQRTPSAVDARGNRPTDAEWFKSLPEGWQQERMHNFDAILAGLPVEENLIADQWSEFWGGISDVVEASGGDPELMKSMLDAQDLEQMERIRRRTQEIVKDPAVAEALKPYYGRFCKRPTFNDEYLESFNRPNVELIDTEGRGLDKITKNAIVVGDTEYPVDCIVFATGFEFLAGTKKEGGFDIVGPQGRSFTEHWAGEIRSLHGIMTKGFPNLFMIGALHQAAVSINFPYILGEQAMHAAALVKRFTDMGIEVAEASQRAEAEWVDAVKLRSGYDEEAARSCTPGAYNNENTYDKPGVFESRWTGDPNEYIEILRDWRETALEGDLEVKRSQGSRNR
ncbi:flavin-containing monooxygenase [Rhodococcus opacus]|uniref:flavin-containing monooxygenase n=1 Tax=Rhodococcus opacus TaxID=37919 RepID=UPI0029558CD9|nr:NAD(P)/FAD-dependent oxidoreductase [Rhodococcus opacus]MDV7089123.1 NAD(P)/FAD-dependent oxidoreductase [Rhodococcus opacus]